MWDYRYIEADKKCEVTYTLGICEKNVLKLMFDITLLYMYCAI